MDAEVKERFDRIEQNMLEFSEGMKTLQSAQLRTQEALNTLLDALFTQRGNGHSKQQPPDYPER